MNILTTPPPVYEKARAKWGIDFERDQIIFAYHPNVHVASGRLEPDLKIHEGTHLKQQEAFPGGVEAWWERYMADDQFRLEQELEAYRAQWLWLQRNEKNREQRWKILNHCARDLSGPIYGHLVGYTEAMRLIQQTQ